MASDCCTAVSFFSTCNRSFYFKVAETDAGLEDDSFDASTQPPWQCLFQCQDSKLLLLNAETFLARDVAVSHPGCEFKIKFFKDDSRQEKEGRAVLLYVEKKDGAKVAVCCSDNQDIVAEEMDLPSSIPKSQHRAIFYMVQLSTSLHSFESSLCPSRFLGFGPCDACPSVRKLTLCYKAKDEVDKTTEFLLRDCKK